MRSQHSRAVLSLIILVLRAATTSAGSECKLAVEQSYEQYNDYELLRSKTVLQCYGDDSVVLRYGSGSTVETEGTAVAELDDLLNDNMKLDGAKDVTFTEFTFRDLEFTDRSPFIIKNCKNCTFQNVIMDSVRTMSDQGGILLNIMEGSEVTIQNAVFTNLGWEGAAPGLANVMQIHDSNVVLKNVSINNVQLVSRTDPTASVVSVSNGSLLAENNVWEDISYDTNQGHLLDIQNGANLELNGCSLTNGRDSASADNPMNVPITIDKGSTAHLSDSVLGRIKVMNGSTAIIRNTSFSSLWARARLTAPVVQFTDSFGAVNDMIFRSASATVNYLNNIQGVMIDVVNSTVNVTNCMFEQTSWSDSIESQVVGVMGGGVLRIANSTFNAVGGCGTAIRATDGSTLEMVGVNITNVDSSQAAYASFATVIITGNSSFYARDSLWGNINAGNATTNAVALSGDRTANVTLYGCKFMDITSLGSPAVQWRYSGGSVDIAQCTWSNINAEAALLFVNVLDGGVIRVSDSRFQGYTSSGEQGALSLQTCPSGSDGGSQAPAVQLSNLTFTNNTAQMAGAAMLVSQCSVSVTGSKFYNNTATGDVAAGSVVYVQGNSNITITSSEFKFNKALSGLGGGALIVRDRSTLTCRDCTFNSNIAAGKGFGGALNLQESSVATLESSIFLENQANDSGGGIFADLSSVRLRKCTFTSNSAKRFGGAIAVLHGNLSIYSGESNSALPPAPTYEDAAVTTPAPAAPVVNEETVFISNRANISGGAIYVQSSNVKFSGSTFTSNIANRYGGAAAVVDCTLFVMPGCTFTRNGASSGGAVLLNATSSNFVGSMFFANMADTYGGAIYTASGFLTIQDSALNANGATSGGAIFVASYLNNNGISMGSTNTSRIFQDTGNITLDRDQIYNKLDEEFPPATSTRIINSAFTQNSCSDALDATGGAILSSTSMLIQSSSFISNTCPNGGAVAFSLLNPYDSVAVVDSSFRFNQGTVRGGAVILLPNNNIALYGLFFNNTFKANSAPSYGGAIDASTVWALDLMRNNFTDNGNSLTYLAGGALSIAFCRNLPTDPPNTANVNLLNNNFTNNLGSRGAAIFSLSCNVTVKGDLYVGNKASSEGGAIHAINTDQRSLTQLQILNLNATGNFAKSTGGAVYLSGQGLYVVDSIFANNTVLVAGGALMIQESSPLALLVLQRTSETDYSTAEYNLLNAVVRNCTFIGNAAATGGGGIYSDRTRMRIQDSVFEENLGGDGMPNDDWSDSGGAIFAAECYGLSQILNSNFTKNHATGGPGGAILAVACSMSVSYSNFDCNDCSTFGGAIATGNRRQQNSTAYTIPSLVVLNSSFTDNRAMLYDGGAVLTKDMNASVYLSTFAGNRAGRNGGALALLNNIGSTIRVCTLKDNSAVQYGGGAYILTNSVLIVEDSEFRSNFAILYGGALSIIGSTCVLTARTSFIGNNANARGGALQLQLRAASSSSGNATVSGGVDGGDDNNGTCTAQGQGSGIQSLAEDAGPCVTQFLAQVKSLASPRGLELLGLSDGDVLSYNSILAYEASQPYLPYFAMFRKGGAPLLPVPRVSGPVQFSVGMNIVPAPGSVVQFALGSSLAAAKWAQLQLRARTSGNGSVAMTQLFFQNSALYAPVKEAVVQLAAGSAITQMNTYMEMLPAGDIATVIGDLLFIGSKLDTNYIPAGNISALSVVLSYKGSATLPDGKKIPFNDWNRYVLRAYGGRSFLLDAFTGTTYDMSGGTTIIELSNCSPLLRHVVGSINVTPLNSSRDVSVTVMPAGGSEGGGSKSSGWRLDNGTTLITGRTCPAVSAVPAKGSTALLASGTSLSVDSWLPYIVSYPEANGAVHLEHLGRGASKQLGLNVSMEVLYGTVVLRPPPEAELLLPRGTNLSGPSSKWGIGGGSTSGNFAVSLVLPAGSTSKLGNSTTVVQDWNRYVLWSGPMGTLLYDTLAAPSNGTGSHGMITMLTEAAEVQLSRATPLVRHTGGIILSYNMDLKVGKSAWILSNGTDMTLNASRVAFTAILAKGCRINGTAVTVDADWYRYLVVTVQNGTFLFDTAVGAIVDSPLPVGTRVSLAKGSALVVHNSFADVLQGGLLKLTDLDAPAVVLPAEGSRLVYGSGSDDGDKTSVAIDDEADTTGRYVPWVGVDGSYLYDTKLLVTFRLAPSSTLNLAENSSLLVHDSRTTVLQEETNLTTTSDGFWHLSNGWTLSVGGDITELSASPTGTSRILYNNSTWNMLVSERRFALQAGVDGITLYDALIDASFQLANGSTLALSEDSTFVQGSNEFPFRDGVNLTVEGRMWVLSNGTELDPGDGTGSSTDSEFKLHVHSSELQPPNRADGEIGRLCSVDLTKASYTPDPYTYDYDMARDFLNSCTATDFEKPDFYSNFARAAYRYGPEVNTSGFNASLLIPLTSIPWDSLGRPTSAIVQCTKYSAPEASSKARDISLLQIDLTIINNTAGAMGGGIYIEGGQGSVLMDNFQVENNTVTNGDGGGLAVYQGDSFRDMQVQVYVASSNFSGNNASTGLGGGIFLASNLLYQQAVLTNLTLDGNQASEGGGLALSKHISVLLDESRIENNTAAVVGMIPAGSEGLNYGNGGGIMASSCNELLITTGTSLRNNYASSRGGGLAAYSCALVTLNDTQVESNEAQSGGGVYTWNDLPVSGSSRITDVGASITIVARSAIVNNSAISSGGNSSSGGNVSVSGNTTNDVLEGIGGGFLVRGHMSTLFADSNFTDNTASSQGGSIFIESTCDLTNQSRYLVQDTEAPTAFKSARLLFYGTVQSLQYPRPKGCWGTVVFLPRFFNNEAARSGGALFSSHPEALSMVCDENVTSTASGFSALMPSDTLLNESALAEQVLMAMKKASYQVLDNRIVQSCYREEIQRIFNRSFENLNLSGVELSTLDISNNRAFGYGYLIAIIPSKLQVVNVSWSGNTSNVASSDTQKGTNVQRRRQLINSASDLGSETVVRQSYSLSDNPFFRIMPGSVFDNDTQSNRTVINYHITAYSNKPMDLPILLLDALDQIAAENTTLRQAQVRANLTGASNGCKAELLGGYEGTARNGTAIMSGLRVRALKGENYTIQFRVEDAMIKGTVEPLVVNITVPPCSIGEVPRDDGYVCQKCDQRSFSLWQDTADLVDCKYDNLDDLICYPCPDGAECVGGAVLVPRQGFWHSAANSTFMNACPNPQACRAGDDEAQDRLLACQEWWYSRPQGFDYQGFVRSVLSGNNSAWLDSIGAAGSRGDAAIAAAATIDLTDPSLCVLWGLPYDHPASYMQKQCTEGYKGHLCAICANDDGIIRASNGDFECNECFSRGTSITIAVLGFVANVATVLVTIILTFMTDYTENEEMGIGDLLKVFIVHMQFFVIVTRINIDWPPSISFITSLMSAFTGAVAKVYAPSCMLNADATPAEVAAINQLVAITSPLLTTLFVALMWMIIRVLIFNLKNATRTEQKLDMRTIEEYKLDRVRRQTEKRRAKEPEGWWTRRIRRGYQLGFPVRRVRIWVRVRRLYGPAGYGSTSPL
ncbi:hypothetical protein Vretimale_17650 [Volvox reticuliferus]|uniref:Uncharacterized protein n=1 Tax=Volvox reticuliferus TaxID=1737510 RepID=A0A8J4LXZ3_9CHLO|nr:hypothetical protein Vretimale_17650 [Volvox reticuliferus]